MASCLVVAADADGVAPSILLTCGSGARRQYLFGCAEGFARLALESRARPSAKLRATFLSSFHPRSCGGLGGLLLRLSADGHERVHVVGPPGVGAHVEALRGFVRFRHPAVTTLRMMPSSPDPGIDADANAPSGPVEGEELLEREREREGPRDAVDAQAQSYVDDSVRVWPLFADAGGDGRCYACERAREDAEEEAKSASEEEEEEEEEGPGGEAGETSEEEDAYVSDDARDDDDDDDAERATEAGGGKRKASDDAAAAPPARPRPRPRPPPRLVGYACAVRGRIDDRAVFLVLDCHDDDDAIAAAKHPIVRCCLAGGGGGGGETASHTTPFAWCTPFLKDFSRRHSSPAFPFQRFTGKTFD